MAADVDQIRGRSAACDQFQTKKRMMALSAYTWPSDSKYWPVYDVISVAPATVTLFPSRQRRLTAAPARNVVGVSPRAWRRSICSEDKERAGGATFFGKYECRDCHDWPTSSPRSPPLCNSADRAKTQAKSQAPSRRRPTRDTASGRARDVGRDWRAPASTPSWPRRDIGRARRRGRTSEIRVCPGRMRRRRWGNP
jgi:hypothetical protein